MATMTIRGCAEYQKALQKMLNTSEGSVKKAIYEGAKQVADACTDSIRSLPTSEGYGTQSKPLSSLRPEEKRGLEESFGLSRMQTENGFIYTKAGFSGYNDVKTKKFPQGQPNVVIARAVESGTSFRVKHPFIRPAVNRSKKQAIYAMDKQLEEDLRFLGF